MTPTFVRRALLATGIAYLALPFVARFLVAYLPVASFLFLRWSRLVGVGLLVAAAVYPRAPRPVVGGIAALAGLLVWNGFVILDATMHDGSSSLPYGIAALLSSVPPLVLAAVAWRAAPAVADAASRRFEVRVLRVLAVMASVVTALAYAMAVMMLPWSLEPVPGIVFFLGAIGIVVPFALIPTLLRRDTRLGAKYAFGLAAAMMLGWLLMGSGYQAGGLFSALLLLAGLLAWPIETPAEPGEAEA